VSFPRYPEYKDSGVEWLGEVPAHWKVRRLRFAAALNPSKSEVRGMPGDTEVSFLPMEAVGENGSLDLEQTRALGDVLNGYTYFKEGDVTLAKITPCFENGKGAIMRGLCNGVGLGTTELTVVRPRHDMVSSEYLFRVISSEPFRALGEAAMYGAGGQKRVPDEFVRNFSIAWPPGQEQGTIAAFLDHETAKIDALVDEQKRLIELLKEKRQAVISHAVTKGLDPTVPMKDSGVEWLGEVPAHWDVSALKHFWTVTDCKHITAEFVDDGVPLASIREVQARYVNLENAKSTTEKYYRQLIGEGRKPEVGDLIFSRNATVGEIAEVAPWHPPFAMGQDVCLLKKGDKSLSSSFLYHLVHSDTVQKQLEVMMVGATFKRVNVEQIRNLVVAMPPAEEQYAISAAIEADAAQIDALIDEAAAAVRLLHERRSSLISAAVTGKIDVRGWQRLAEEQQEWLQAAEERPAYG